MAEPKTAVRSQGSEYSESSQHDMMSLVNMATGTEPSKAPTANEIGDQLRTQQWGQYLSEQLVKNRASNKIAFLASNVKAAMEDRSTKDKKGLSDKVTAFFTKNMCRVPGAKIEDAHTDQTYSLQLIYEQMASQCKEIGKITEWISTSDTAQQWIRGVIAGLAHAGLNPPNTKDTRKYTCKVTSRFGHY